MRPPRHRILPILGLVAVLLPARAQEPASVAAADPAASSDPALFPSGAPSSGSTPDFSTSAAPASSFGAPDFSATSPSGSSAAAATGGAAGAKVAGAKGAGVTATPPAATETPGGGGFAPGPYSSPASTTPTTPNGVAAPASVFGTTSLGSGTGLGAGAGTGTAGLGGANTRTPSASSANSFSLPGGYGQAPLSFSAGQGRLARPRFVWTGTQQLGYDDNVLLTPTATRGTLPVEMEVVVQPAVPAHQEVQLLPFPDGTRTDGIGVRPRQPTRIVDVPFQPAKTKKILVSPGIPAQERVGSAVSRTGLGLEMQMSSRRTVFTMDAHVSADYYLSRPKDHTDFNGNLSAIFAHRLSSRTQFSASVNVAYLSQPDVRVVSGPTRNVGDYLTGNVKADLTYQWAKRFSTVSSIAVNTLNYANSVQAVNDSIETTFGTEGRYLWSRRLTVVGEVRYSTVTYSKLDSRDSSTYFLLVGGDFAFSPRLSGTIRVGESLRSFDSGGGSSLSPYLELTGAYRFSPRGSLTMNSRFGFEEPQDATSEVLVFRTNVSAVQAFTARLRGSVSLAYIHRTTTSDGPVQTSDITGDTFTIDLGLNYALTKKFSISGSYTLIEDLSSLDQTSYYRNQIFLGAQYTF